MKTMSYLNNRSFTDSRYSVMNNISRNTMQDKINQLERYRNANCNDPSWSPSKDIACNVLMDDFQHIVNSILQHKTLPPVVVSEFERRFYSLMQDVVS